MQLCIYSGIQKAVKDLSLYDIDSTATLYSYFLRKEFDKLGVETIPCRDGGFDVNNYKNFKIPDCDHILSVEQRGWYNRQKYVNFPLEDLVRKHIKGKICTICDHNILVGYEDLLFYATPMKPHQESKPKTVLVGWAASPEVCFPEKDPDILRILIDHSYYGNPEKPGVPDRDISDSIIRSCLNFSKKSEKKVILRRFISNGVETIKDESFKKDIYNRSGIPYPEACEEYRKADIFIVTHPESLGISVIESAMSGALIIVPFKYIKIFLTEDLLVYTFDPGQGEIDWDVVISMLNIEEAREKALKHSWNHVASMMLEHIND